MIVGHPASQKLNRGDIVTHTQRLGSRMLVMSIHSEELVYLWDGENFFLCRTHFLQKMP
jgi:hypothetical protein